LVLLDVCKVEIIMGIKRSFFFVLYIFIGFWFGCSPFPDFNDATVISRPVNIQPDYSGIIIPPNIAPLNFRIEEAGSWYYVKINGPLAPSIQIQGKSPEIRIPLNEWKSFLMSNKGNSYKVEIALKDSVGNLIRFSPIENRISTDSIDPYLAYRRLGPLYTLWKKMGIYQRCLEDFKESPIMVNRLTQDNCMNCHNFCNSNPDRWLIHLRGGPGTAMLLIHGDEVHKVDTKTEFNGPVAYPAWHPSGNLAVFSSNKLLLFFHSLGEPRDVLDRASNLVVYNIPTNVLTTTSQIASPDRMENWPAWSPDGKYLYFSSAPELETFEDPPQQDLAYSKIRYDLMRVSYNEESGTWGELELVLSGSKVGGSINQARISPDGQFALFTVSLYGNFPIYNSSADLYLLNLSSGEVKKLELNSESTESFHAWSSNGRWVVFSSKRIDNLFARPYFAYVDGNGNTSKPFILPQKNPEYYETCLETFNVPEFILEPVRISAKRLAKTAYQDAQPVKLDPKWITVQKREEVPISNPQPQ
jgi:hypothetical protein